MTYGDKKAITRIISEAIDDGCERYKDLHKPVKTELRCLMVKACHDLERGLFHDIDQDELGLRIVEMFKEGWSWNKEKVADLLIGSFEQYIEDELDNIFLDEIEDRLEQKAREAEFSYLYA